MATRIAQPPAPPSVQAPVWPAWPTYGLIDDLLPTLARWRDRGEAIAIATLVQITGSSPRPLGSEMAVSGSGDIAGYVSGGCVEGAVAAQAREVIATGEPAMLDYGAGSPVLDVQLTCGGRIGIFVRALADPVAYVARLEAARSERKPLTIAIDLASGAHYFDRGEVGEGLFRQVQLPLPRLLVAGGDPITLALCQLAPTLGFEVGLLRPYGPAVPPDGSQLFHYDTRPLARAREDMPIDEYTSVYTLTHDMDDDHEILLRALQSPAFAIGVLGSRRKLADREAGLRAAGIDDAQLARLSAPAGVDVNARNPREIALSMLAELVARRPRADAVAG